MPKTQSTTMQEKKWRAEDDARTLVQAGVITTDKTRLRAAKVQAKIMAKEKVKELKSLKKISKKPIRRKKS